ncbi:MAG TPA: GNAT family N-acetyltransferase [Patescibacteria group bacterium]|nr:GNAT family N-acetyltransferase [Patescibacteria group bacterium]
MSKVIVRRFRERDREKTLQFLKTIFGGWHSLRQWIWKFRDVEKAQGRKSIIWVMEADGKIAGHLAAIPMKLRIGTEVVTVCQLVDGATSPQYRHKGLYRKLFQELLNDVAESGFAATFGLPNRFFYHLCERQGSFKNICQIKKMFKVLSLRNAADTLRINLSEKSADTGEDSLLKDFFVAQKEKAVFMLWDFVRKVLVSTAISILGSRSKSGKIELPEIEPKSLGTEFDGSWMNFSRNYKFAFERDKEFLNWRYSNPEANYRAYVVRKRKTVAGYVVIALEEKSISLGRLRFSGLKEGFIVDLVAEKNLILPLISVAEEELEKRQACWTECWATEDSRLFKTLRTGMYHQLPDEMYKVYFVAKVHAQQLKGKISSEYNKDILVSLGDSDIV